MTNLLTLRSFKLPSLAFYAVVLTVAVLCSISTSISSAEPRLKVGVILPLSGALAEYGLAARNGIELARASSPTLFRSIDFIYQDSQWDSAKSVAALSHLRTVDNVDLVFNWGNPTTEAIAPIAERYQMPLLAMSLDPKVARGKKFVIRTINSAADFASATANNLVDRGFRRVGVVMADNTYLQGLFDGIRNTFGGSVEIEVVDRYALSDQDFRSSISKVRARNYDALGVFLISGQVSTFYRQLRLQGLTLPTLGSDFFESSTEIKLAQGGMEGAVYAHLKVAPSFRDKYVARFKNDYQIAYAGNAYDMAMLLGQRLGSTQAKLPAQIMAQLRAPTKVMGVGGSFQFLETSIDGPHFHFPVQLKRIQGEEMVEVSDH